MQVGLGALKADDPLRAIDDGRSAARDGRFSTRRELEQECRADFTTEGVCYKITVLITKYSNFITERELD